MNVFEETRPLVIDVPGGGRRNIAELFDLEDYIGVKGIIFVDVFFPETSSHPVHWIKGELAEMPGKNPAWFIENEAGEDVMIELLDEERDPGLFDERKRWIEYRTTDPIGVKATRESVDETLRQWAKAGIFQ